MEDCFVELNNCIKDVIDECKENNEFDLAEKFKIFQDCFKFYLHGMIANKVMKHPSWNDLWDSFSWLDPENIKRDKICDLTRKCAEIIENYRISGHQIKFRRSNKGLGFGKKYFGAMTM